VEGEKEPALILTHLKVEAKITSFLAETSYTMTFRNPYAKQLSGELRFPLPETATINGFAMEMNGPGTPLIPAVPVEKEVAKVAFEQAVKEHKAAGLVEEVVGNIFSNKIYPIPALSTKTVRVTYLSEVQSDTNSGAGLFIIPLSTDEKYPLEVFDIDIQVKQQMKQKPKVEQSPLDAVDFQQSGGEEADQHTFTAKATKKGVVLGKPTVIRVPMLAATSPMDEILVEKGKLPLAEDEDFLSGKSAAKRNEDGSEQSGEFFIVNDYVMIEDVRSGKIESKYNRIGVIYDASHSRQKSDKTKELQVIRDLVEQELKDNNKCKVDLILLRNTPEKIRPSGFGSADELIQELKQVVFDGATALSGVRTLKTEGESEYGYYIVVTDGLGSVGRKKPQIEDLQAPAFVLSSEAANNATVLRFIAQKTGGRYYNLLANGASATIVKDIQDRVSGKITSFGFRNIKHNRTEVEQIFPKRPFEISGPVGSYQRVTFCGILRKKDKTVSIEINYGTPQATTYTSKITLIPSGKDSTTSNLISRYWAQQKVSDLKSYGTKPKSELTKLGQRYGFVTEGTSLLILSSVDEYLKHKVVPDPEAMPDIAKQMRSIKESSLAIEQQRIQTKLNLIESKWNTCMTSRNRKVAAPAPAPSPIQPSFSSTNSQGSARAPPTQGAPSPPPTQGAPSPPPNRGAPPPPPTIFLSAPRPVDSLSAPSPVPPSSRNSQSAAPRSKKKMSFDAAPQKEKKEKRSASQEVEIFSSPTHMESSLSCQVESSLDLDEFREEEVDEGYPAPEAHSVAAPGAHSVAAPGAHSVAAPGAHSVAAPGAQRTGGGAVINLTAWDPNVPYMTSIKSAKTTEQAYEAYLKEKLSNQTSPAFFLDVAEHFLRTRSSRLLGLRILTNLCEINIEDPQLMRVIGYKLDQEEEKEQAKDIFKRVLKLRGHEPQSYRDLGLVEERLGDYENALIHLWNVVTGSWFYAYDEIELTALVEINKIIWRLKTDKKFESVTLPDNLDLKRWEKDVQMDVRISMAWDTDSTDVDLHVIEPSGTDCHYANKLTAVGGTLSRDFTMGYGPEEYTCKVAPEGKYVIKAKYFSSHRQDLLGGTTILASVFTHYCTERENRQMITLRLQSTYDIVPIGEITFKK